MNNYRYTGQFLTPGVDAELIIELFAGQTVATQDIKRSVDQEHRNRGGLPSQAKRHHPVALALSMELRPAGRAKSISHGNWQIFSNPQVNEDGSPGITTESANTQSAKIIGTGESSVYLYYYPTYCRLAMSEGKSVWPCKIGMAGYGAEIRVHSQVGTALPESPEIGIIIQTDEPELLEQTIQNILKLRGKHK